MAGPSPWEAARGAVVGLVSLYDYENNAVRQLSAALRGRGYRVVEIYFKDWINNRLEEPCQQELDDLVKVLQDNDVGLVGVSLRASAYERVASTVCQHIRVSTGIPLVLGGWHPTVRPADCMPFADALCIGEADRAFPAFIDTWAAHRGQLEPLLDAANFWIRDASGVVHRNPQLPLVTDLDSLPWRDYTSPDKWVIHRGTLRRGDPMAKDPVFQVMCSIGCIQKCGFCHNSFEGGAPGPSLRVRSVDSVLAEFAARRADQPGIRRVRFDDEIFGLDRHWLREFADRYPREVGLPFDILTEPTVVGEEYADLLQQAGARYVHMGIQSTESINRDKLSRRATRSQTSAAVERLSGRGLIIRYLVMIDIPDVSEDDWRELFEFLQGVPRPYDLYLFSLTWFPGSRMVEDMLATGELHSYQVEGRASKTFSQYRVDLGYPRAPRDRWWAAMLVIQASGVVPRRILGALVRRGWSREDPRQLVLVAHACTLVKTARVGQQMARDGELTATLVRRWWNPQQMITM